jgi:DNA helicase-2/ATP-dependent DNA helicase PcrA
VGAGEPMTALEKRRPGGETVVIEAGNGPDDLLQDLNPPQREAVSHRGGPLMILAGAGSGKTRVITYRIAHLLATGEVRPWQVLAVTFTNKAAREMRERVWSLLGRTERDLWVSTFHAACARMLRGHAHLLGFEQNFSIYDDHDQITVVESCLRDLDLDPTRFSPRMILTRIRAAKQLYQSAAEMLDRGRGNYLEERIGRVYHRYQERLQEAQAMDFDDLLFLTLRMFEQHPEILEYYRNRWRHVLVDEFQDTNQIQYRIVRALSEAHRNICVVGDDDQSIYSWRGADLGNILGFEEDFPETRIIRLEQNYRSTQTILDAAGGVIGQNRHRKGKSLWTENEAGERLSLYQALDERDEALFVVDEIRHLLKSEGLQPGDVAVFYRTHAQSRVLEEEFLKRRLPFAIYGGLGFYERREIKDIVAYLRALSHPADDLSWRRVLNTPKRGIGRQTIQAVDALANREGIPFSAALRRHARDAHGRPAKNILAFLSMMDRLKEGLHRWSVGRAVNAVIDETGYLRELERSNDPRCRDRVENVQELINLVGEYEADEENAGGDLADFLERVSLVSDLDRMDEREDRVSLLTLHGAKGLEFPIVFIVGMEERLLPHSLSMDDPTDLEEERRLCYVGMTRAQRRLYLTFAERRRIWGTPQYLEPSRFLTEIPEACMSLCSPSAPDFRGSGENEEDSAVQGVFPGRWVRHRAFGVGTVQKVDRNGTQVVIHFPGRGDKRFMLDQAPLEWL